MQLAILQAWTRRNPTDIHWQAWKANLRKEPNVRRLLPSVLGFPGVASGNEPTCQCRRRKRCRFDPWVGKITWRREWQPTQYSCLENPMDWGAWWATVRGASKSRTRLKQLSMQHALDGCKGIMVRSEAVGPARAPFQQFIVLGNIERKEREGPRKNERREQNLINKTFHFWNIPSF